MRIAGIGVLALLLVGILIYLGQSGAFDGVRNPTSDRTVARFEDANQTVLANFDTDGSTVFGAPVVQDNPLILSGLPSYAGMEFRLPVDARATSGDLDLVFTSLVAQNVEGVLRVAINGVKRADYLLEAGERNGRLEVQLTPRELASGVVNVGLSLQGRGPIAECTSDDAIAAVVSVNGASGLRLNLSDTPSSVRDRLGLWGDRVPVSWSASANASDKASIIHQAALLSWKGYSPVFAESGVALDDLRSLTNEAKPRSSFTAPAAYPIALLSDPINEGLRKFTRRVNWRYAYDVADLPGGRLPSALDLRMLIGPSTNRLQRDVVVTLNNRLLFSRRIADGAERLNQSVTIPAELHRRVNTLDITVSAYDAQDLRCGDIAQSVAELLPETVLRDGTAQLQDETSALRAVLARLGSARFEAEGLSGPDALASATLLSALAPSQWEVNEAATGVTIRSVPNAAAAASLPQERDMTRWLVYTSAKFGGQVMAQRLPGAPIADVEGLALLVTVQGASTPAAETPPQG